jgi:hypothetical protein
MVLNKVKLPAHRAGLSGKETFIYIVSLDPIYPAKAGRGTCRSRAFNPDEHHHRPLRTGDLGLERFLSDEIVIEINVLGPGAWN